MVTFSCVTVKTTLALSCEAATREICKKAQHSEVASRYSGFDRPIVYTALIPNWCFWETPPMSDPENFLICPTRLQPSAVIVGCKIIFQRKRTGEKRGWKHRAEEIRNEQMGYRRMDNIGMTNISAEGGRACQSIYEDCTTKLSEAAFKQNGVHIFPLPYLSLSACIQPLLALSLPLTPWKLEASSSWKFQGLAGLTTFPRKLHWSTSLSFAILSTGPGHAVTTIQGWSCGLCQPLEQSTFGCNGSLIEKLKLRGLGKMRYSNA